MDEQLIEQPLEAGDPEQNGAEVPEMMEAPAQETLEYPGMEAPDEPVYDPVNNPFDRAHFEAFASQLGYGPQQTQPVDQGPQVPEGWEFMDLAEQAMWKAQQSEAAVESLKQELAQKDAQLRQQQIQQQVSAAVSSHIAQNFGDQAGAELTKLFAQDPSLAVAYAQGYPAATFLIEKAAEGIKAGGVANRLLSGAKQVPATVSDQAAMNITDDESKMVKKFKASKHYADLDESDILETIRAGRNN